MSDSHALQTAGENTTKNPAYDPGFLAAFRAACRNVGESVMQAANMPRDPFGRGNRVTYNVASHWNAVHYMVNDAHVPCIHAPPPGEEEPTFRITIVTGLKGMTSYMRDQIRILNKLGGSVTCINFPDPGKDVNFLHHYEHIMRNITVENPIELPEDKEDVPHILITHSTAGMLGLLEQSRKRDAKILGQRYNGIIHLAPMLGSSHRDKSFAKWAYKAWAGICPNQYYGAMLSDRIHSAMLCLAGHPDYIDTTRKKNSCYRLKTAFNELSGITPDISVQHNPTHSQNQYMIERSEEIADHLQRYGFPKELAETPTRIIFGTREFISNTNTIRNVYDKMQDAIHHRGCNDNSLLNLIPIQDGGHFLLHHNSRTRRIIFGEIIDMLQKDAPELADKIRREGDRYLEDDNKAAKSRLPRIRQFFSLGNQTPD